MNIEAIRELRLAYPFEPFELVMDDGRRFLVDKPYYLGIAPDGGRIGYSLEGNGIALFTADRVLKAQKRRPVAARSAKKPRKKVQR